MLEMKGRYCSAMRRGIVLGYVGHPGQGSYGPITGFCGFPVMDHLTRLSAAAHALNPSMWGAKKVTRPAHAKTASYHR